MRGVERRRGEGGGRVERRRGERGSLTSLFKRVRGAETDAVSLTVFGILNVGIGRNRGICGMKKRDEYGGRTSETATNRALAI